MLPRISRIQRDVYNKLPNSILERMLTLYAETEFLRTLCIQESFASILSMTLPVTYFNPRKSFQASNPKKYQK